VSDDAVRLWVNDILLIDKFTSHPVTRHTAIMTIALTAGQKYDIRMEYFEVDTNAVAQLLWTQPGQEEEVIPTTQLYPEPIPVPVQGTGTGLLARYYNGRAFDELKVIRTDTRVANTWETGVPASDVNADDFFVRWSGQVQPRFSGEYKFYAISDAGVRLWVKGEG